MKHIKTIALSMVAVGMTASMAGAEELIVNSYGGPYKKIIHERIIEPFKKKFDIKVIYDATGSSSQDYAKIKATNGRPGFDVNVMTASQSLQGCADGLLEKFSVGSVPNLKHLDAGVKELAGPCAAVHEVQYMALLWRTDKIPTPPTSWNALGDPAYKNKILLPKYSNVMAIYLTQVLSTMHGGTLEDPGPGFAAMAKLAPQALSFERSSAIMSKYVREGRVWISPFWSGRAQLLQDAKVPVNYAIPREGTVPLIATLNVPVGAQNKVAAMKFVNFFLSKTGQEAWVTGYNVGSIRTDLDLPKAVREKQITTKADIEKLHLPDFEMISAKRAEWGKRWKREVSAAAD